MRCRLPIKALKKPFRYTIHRIALHGNDVHARLSAAFLCNASRRTLCIYRNGSTSPVSISDTVKLFRAIDSSVSLSQYTWSYRTAPVSPHSVEATLANMKGESASIAFYAEDNSNSRTWNVKSDILVENTAKSDYLDAMDVDAAANEVYNIAETQPASSEEEPIKLRSYQSEMLEASLKRNVIVAMDTGSGKTHIAIARIQHELETATDPDKLVWFMCPSVALSLQQYAVISEHLPGYLIKTLMGADGVDKWTTQSLWDGVLKNVRVVVGTPKVLEEALTHGFVQISNIVLLVFDEAHRCSKETPMNTIMQHFYHPTKAKGKEVPNVLGLTASPIISEKSGTLETIEANLDAVTITPKRHRSELEAYVHPPELSRIVYADSTGLFLQSGAPLCRALGRAVDSYDVSTDPWFKELSQYGDDKSRRKLEKLWLKPDTYCYKQLKALRTRSKALTEQLGISAAEWYVRQCIQRYNGAFRTEMPVLMDVGQEERQHLRKIFDSMLDDSTFTIGVDVADMITDKVKALINLLNNHTSSPTRGIVFVEQRAAVAALAHILSTHPALKAHYSIGSFVGTSTFSKRETGVADLADSKEQQKDLTDFRNGIKNLMIATNVLEEGIDVSACNLVVCFDPPKNLVSFVQRRGRARQKASKYVIFLPEQELHFDPSKWQRLEAEMRQAYMDERRELALIEKEEEHEDDTDDRVYRISGTVS